MGEITSCTVQQVELKAPLYSILLSMQEIPYADLMASLDIANIRELEDLLITECFYSGLVTGKLDQRRQCLRVADAVSRDVRAGDLAPVLAGLAAWYAGS